jgi:hypothetical protein
VSGVVVDLNLAAKETVQGRTRTMGCTESSKFFPSVLFKKKLGMGW